MNREVQKRNQTPFLEQYPMGIVLLANLVYVVMWISEAGTVGWYRSWDLPILSILWLVVVAVIWVLLKKHNCTNCYYYGKRCALGWGVIARNLFKKDSGNANVGKVVSIVFYGVMPLLFLIGALTYVGMATKVSLTHYLSTSGLAATMVLTFPIRRYACCHCHRRDVCEGSTCKKGLPSD